MCLDENMSVTRDPKSFGNAIFVPQLFTKWHDKYDFGEMHIIARPKEKHITYERDTIR